MSTRNIPKGLVPDSFQTLDVSSAVSLNSTVISADVVLLSVATQSIRMRADGTDPTATTGVLFIAGNSPYWLDNFNKTSDVKFIEATGGADVQVQGFIYRAGVS